MFSSRRSTSFIRSSREAVAGNARVVRERFGGDRLRRAPRSWCVIAHSRGWLRRTCFRPPEPRVSRRTCHHVVLDSRAHLAEPAVADYVVGGGPPMDKRMPLAQPGRRRGELANAEGFLLDRGKHGGLPSLTRQASAEFWQDLLRESSQRPCRCVGPKTFYVTTQDLPFGASVLPRTDCLLPRRFISERTTAVQLRWSRAVAGPWHGTRQCSTPGTPISRIGCPSGRAAQRMRKAVIDAIIMGKVQKSSNAPANARGTQDRSVKSAHSKGSAHTVLDRH